MAAALHRISRGAQSFFFSEKPAALRHTIHTSVWWDLHSCEIPQGCHPVSVVGNITDALAKLSYDAPATFSIYGDWHRYSFSREDIETLSKRGARIKPLFPRPEEANLVSKRILYDIWLWSKDYPAPHDCLLVSGDEHLSFALHQLRMRGYGILLAKPRTGKALGTMEAAAKTEWQWTSLLAGGPPERTSQSIAIPVRG